MLTRKQENRVTLTMIKTAVAGAGINGLSEDHWTMSERHRKGERVKRAVAFLLAALLSVLLSVASMAAMLALLPYGPQLAFVVSGTVLAVGLLVGYRLLKPSVAFAIAISFVSVLLVAMADMIFYIGTGGPY